MRTTQEFMKGFIKLVLFSAMKQAQQII